MGRKKTGEKLKKLYHGQKGLASKTSPFEVHINRSKYQVIGRKRRQEIGMPGVSRSKSFKKRKASLLPQLQYGSKANRFVDQRIGECLKGLSHDDRMAVRYATEFQQNFSRKSMFSLDADEELTHAGHPLDNPHALSADPRSDSEDEEDAQDKLDKGFVRDMHFGGFLKKKEGSEYEDNQPKSRKERLEEMIAVSKQKKAERQQEKEGLTDLREKLDSQFSDMAQWLLSSLNRKKEDEEEERGNNYNMLLQELKFNPKAKPTDRTMSSEEESTLERRRREQLENDRWSRMLGQPLTAGLGHRSADALTNQALPEQFIKTESLLSNVSRFETGIAESFMDKLQLPDSDKKFIKLMRSLKDPQEQKLVLEALVKSHHPSLGGGNRLKLQNLTSFLLKWIEYNCERGSFEHLDTVTPILYDLCHIVPFETGVVFAKIIRSQKGPFIDPQGFWNSERVFPLIFLKLLGLLYPTSDQKHPVCSPASVVLIQLLGTCPLRSWRHIVSALFLVNVALEYVSVSHRYIPEVVCVLYNLLITGVTNSEVDAMKLLAPFPLRLVIAKAFHFKNTSGVDVTDFTVPLSHMRKADRFSINERLCLLHSLLQLLTEMLRLYSGLPSLEIFDPLKQIIPAFMRKNNIPESLTSLVSKIQTTLNLIYACPRVALQQERPRPKPLRLYEPLIEENFNFAHPTARQKFGEKERLQKRYKREMKGALREVRHDSAFVSSYQLQERLQRDAERKDKVKQLMTSLQSQEGEYKSIQKMKRKAKR